MRYILLPMLLSAMALWGQGYDLRPERVAPKLYCFFGAVEIPNRENNGNMVNTCYIDAGKGWVVFDSGPTHRYAEEAFEAMQGVKRQPVLAVFNSHYHDDHWLGNGFYSEKNIPIYASGNFGPEYTAVPTRIEKAVDPAFYRGTVPVGPNRFVAEPGPMHIGDLELHVLTFRHPAHTDADLALFLPKEHIVLAGDIVFNDRLPSLRDGSLKGWRQALEELHALKWEVLVGGHGFKTGGNALDFIEAYLTKLHAKVKKAIAEDVGMEEAQKFGAMPEYETMALYEELHGKNVLKAYEELEWDEE